MQTLTIGAYRATLAPTRDVGAFQAKLAKCNGKSRRLPLRDLRTKAGFPVFTPGMSTAEYVKAYSSGDGSQLKAWQWAQLNEEPCTLYSGEDTCETLPDGFDTWEDFDAAQSADAAPESTLAAANDDAAPTVPDPEPAAHGEDLDRTPIQNLPNYARLAIERAGADSSLRSTAKVSELVRAYAATHGAIAEEWEIASALYICSCRFWDFDAAPDGAPAAAPIADPVSCADDVADAMREAMRSTHAPTNLQRWDGTAYVPCDHEAATPATHSEPAPARPVYANDHLAWAAVESGRAEPDEYQARLIECLGEVKAGGLFYNSDTYPATAALMTARYGYPDWRGDRGQSDGVANHFGLDCYRADSVIRARAERERERGAAATFTVGQRFARLIFNDGKQRTAAELVTLDPAGFACKLKAKSGRNSVEITCSAYALSLAVIRAEERGKVLAAKRASARPEPIAPMPAEPAPVPGKLDAAPERIEPDIFIRRATSAERMGNAPRQRAMRSLVPMVGHTVMFKPYGHKGAGFYWVLDRRADTLPSESDNAAPIECEPVPDVAAEVAAPIADPVSCADDVAELTARLLAAVARPKIAPTIAAHATPATHSDPVPSADPLPADSQDAPDVAKWRAELRSVEDAILRAAPARYSNGRHGCDIEAAARSRSVAADLKRQRKYLRARLQGARMMADAVQPAPVASAPLPGKSEPDADPFDAWQAAPNDPKPTFGAYSYAKRTGRTVVAYCGGGRIQSCAKAAGMRYVHRVQGFVGTPKQAEKMRAAWLAGAMHNAERAKDGVAEPGSLRAMLESLDVPTHAPLPGDTKPEALDDDETIPAPLDGLDVAELGDDGMAEFEQATREQATAPAYRELTTAHYRPQGPCLRIPAYDARAMIPQRFAPSYLLQA